MGFGTARAGSITEYSGNPLRIWNAKTSPSGVSTAINAELTMITTVAADPDGDSGSTPIASGRDKRKNFDKSKSQPRSNSFVFWGL